MKTKILNLTGYQMILTKLKSSTDASQSWNDDETLKVQTNIVLMNLWFEIAIFK